MSENNPGSFFQPENFDDEDDDRNSENWKPVKIYGNELFKKAIDILNLTKRSAIYYPRMTTQI